MLMKTKTAKTLLNALLPLVGLFILVSVSAVHAETTEMTGFDEFVADNEPMPCSISSFQEIAPFDPILLSPHELMTQIDECKSSEEIRTLARALALPLSDGDCDYIDQCRNHRAYTRYSLPEGQWAFSEVSTLTYTFADLEDRSDNLTLVFVHDGENDRLMDILISFDNPQVVTDADHETI